MHANKQLVNSENWTLFYICSDIFEYILTSLWFRS